MESKSVYQQKVDKSLYDITMDIHLRNIQKKLHKIKEETQQILNEIEKAFADNRIKDGMTKVNIRQKYAQDINQKELEELINERFDVQVSSIYLRFVGIDVCKEDFWKFFNKPKKCVDIVEWTFCFTPSKFKDSLAAPNFG